MCLEPGQGSRRPAAVNNHEVCALRFCDMSHGMTYWTGLSVHWASAACNQLIQASVRIFLFERENSTGFAGGGRWGDRARERDSTCENSAQGCCFINILAENHIWRNSANDAVKPGEWSQ